MTTMDAQPTLIVITGPTAVGKTDLAISIALKFKAEIISADSRQIYREISIGTAKPSPDQLQRVPHHFIGSRSVTEYYNAFTYEVEVLELLGNLFQKHPVTVIVGGSGMYIDAVCNGIDDLPTIDQELRTNLLRKFEQEGLEYLWGQLKLLDPDYFATVDLKNHKRLLKAIEVSLMTGRPYSSLLTGVKKKREFRIVKIGLNMERDLLYDRINKRVDLMMQQGLPEEVKSLSEYSHLNALNTVGYKELFSYLRGECSLDEAAELIKRNTRRYAKRQLTWFMRDEEICWFAPDETSGIDAYIRQKTGQ